MPITTGSHPAALQGGRKKHWMHGVADHMHKGALHRALDVPEGTRIPEKKMEQAERSDNPKVRKMAALARTFERAHK